MPISNKMTVVALVNGMIGGIILAMPILALQTGLLLIAPICIITGFFSYYSCLLCLRHLQHYNDLDQSILQHFNNKKGYKIFYDLVIVTSMSTLLILYFNLISQQWYGMTSKTFLIPILNAIALFPLIYIMKKFDFGASLLGYGILSIVGYCLFLLWMLIVQPSGDKKVPIATANFVELAAALAQGFAIQTFFIPVLKKNLNRELYKKLLGLTYILGTSVYTYIGYSGSFSLVNLTPITFPVQTVQDYFGNKQWQVIILQVIYLVHLYSAFPQFLLVAKKRFFSIFEWSQPKIISLKQILYVSITILICLGLTLADITVQVIIDINGAVVSFFFIYVIPIGLHIKCVYFTPQSQRHHKHQDEIQDIKNNKKQQQDKDIEEIKVQTNKQQRQRQMKQIQLPSIKMQSQPFLIAFSNKRDSYRFKPDLDQIEQTKQRQDVLDGFHTLEVQRTKKYKSQSHIGQGIQNLEQLLQNRNSYIPCDVKFYNKFHEICEIVTMVFMILTGIFIMGYTFYTLINDAVNGNKRSQ